MIAESMQRHSAASQCYVCHNAFCTSKWQQVALELYRICVYVHSIDKIESNFAISGVFKCAWL